jgi:Ran GTPase-activating protein (RanGAP) involved in mRNA processing and transport
MNNHMQLSLKIHASGGGQGLTFRPDTATPLSSPTSSTARAKLGMLDLADTPLGQRTAPMVSSVRRLPSPREPCRSPITTVGGYQPVGVAEIPDSARLPALPPLVVEPGRRTFQGKDQLQAFSKYLEEVEGTPNFESLFADDTDDIREDPENPESNEHASTDDAATLYRRLCDKLLCRYNSKFVALLHQKTVDLSHFSFGARGAVACAGALRLNTTVEHVNFSDNNMSVQGGLAFGKLVGVNTSIKVLTLEENKILAGGASAIVSALGTNGTLEVLSLRSNGISDALSATVCPGLGWTGCGLRSLDLSYNKLGNRTAKELGKILRRNHTLETLNLSWNQIGGDGAKGLAAGLKVSTSLKHLHLAWNSLGEHGGCAMAEAVALNGSMRHLDLSQNRLTSTAGMILADALLFNDTLCTLIMSHNPLGRSGTDGIYINFFRSFFLTGNNYSFFLSLFLTGIFLSYR